MSDQQHQTEAAGGGSALTAELAMIAAIRKLAMNIERDLRTSEYLIFRTAWNAALDAAAEKIKEPWGHETDDTEACRSLKVDHG